MCADSSYRKSSSPQISTEVSSLQLNRVKNKEALEKGLRARRSIKELVNQGILLNPSISHPDKVRQLQRAKTTDLLKHKIEKRPDRQYLISHHILRDDRSGKSPYVLEQCHNLEKCQLKESLNSRLISRPGTLELVEKGVLRVDPCVDTLIKQGSIQYPRVGSILADNPLSVQPFEVIEEQLSIPSPPPIPSPSDRPTSSRSSTTSNASKNRTTSSGRSSTGRTMRDETIVYKLGSLVFHQYCPDSSSSSSPSLSSTASFQQKQKAREAQQAEMLRLQDTARAHRLMEQELCQRTKLNASLFSHIQPSTHAQQTVLLQKTIQSPSFSLSASNSEALINLSHMASRHFMNMNTGNNSNSTNQICSLDQLNLTQLRTECRERKLSRSGSKAFLIRQLEPYRNEILTKYFPNSAPITTNVNYVTTSSTVALPQPLSSHCSLPLQYFDTQFNPNLVQTQAGSISQPLHSQINGDTLHIHSNLVGVTFPLGNSSLRHSVSAPYFTEYHLQTCSQLPSVHENLHCLTTIPVNVTCVDSISCLSSTKPPVLDQSCAPLVHIGDLHSASLNASQHLLTYVGQLSNNLISSNHQIIQQQFHHSSVIASVPEQTSTNSESVTATKIIPITTVYNGDDTANHQGQSLTTLTTSQISNNSDQSLHCEMEKGNLQSKNKPSVIIYNNNKFTTVNSINSLHQIEDMWLRIRKLRNQIMKFKCENSQSTDNICNNSLTNEITSSQMMDSVEQPNSLTQLEQEHERLTILCRLLIIQCLDNLDESIALNKSQSKSNVTDNSFDLQFERDLMISYLNKLGGATLINCSNQNATSGHQHNDHFSDNPLLVTPLQESPACAVSTAASNMDHSKDSILFTANQTMSTNYKDSLLHDLQDLKAELTTHVYDDNTMSTDTGSINLTDQAYDAVFDSLSSPMLSNATDGLFDFWESVTMSDQSDLIPNLLIHPSGTVNSNAYVGNVSTDTPIDTEASTTTTITSTSSSDFSRPCYFYADELSPPISHEKSQDCSPKSLLNSSGPGNNVTGSLTLRSPSPFDQIKRCDISSLGTGQCLPSDTLRDEIYSSGNFPSTSVFLCDDSSRSALQTPVPMSDVRSDDHDTSYPSFIEKSSNSLLSPSSFPCLLNLNDILMSRNLRDNTNNFNNSINNNTNLYELMDTTPLGL